jgi:hypothetical protein
MPEYVMRTGVIAPYSPYAARRDTTQRAVMDATRVPVGIAQQPLAPGMMLLGSNAMGRPVVSFDLPHDAGPEEAQRMGAQLHHLASVARRAGFSLPPAAVGAPLAALVAGSTVVLRFRSGAQVSVTA